MTFFDQQAVVCPRCQKRYALGQFTAAELQHFGIQLKNGYWKQEKDRLLHAQALLSVYPELSQLKEVDYISSLTDATMESWLLEHVPSIAGRRFTKEDREALNVLKDHRFSQGNSRRHLEQVLKQLDRLKSSLEASTSYCQHCNNALEIETANLLSEYRWALEDMAGEIGEHDYGGCLGCIVIFGLLTGWGLIAGPWEVKVGCVFLFSILIYGVKSLQPKKLELDNRQKSAEFGRCKEEIFRGRYFSSSMNLFEWMPEESDQVRQCRLLIPDKSVWSWCDKILETERAKVEKDTKNISAEFEVEFYGLQIAKGKFTFSYIIPGGYLRERRDAEYLVEVLEVWSVKLVKINHKTVPAAELLRPSQAPDAPEEELLRPVKEQQDGDPSEMLRGSEAEENL